jgi:primosomal protein N' (replication factor Y)
VHVAVGERSAVFAPVPDLGLILVDDEANPAWKERRSPRHHVREVALARARMADAVCVLHGDLPSAALWRLLEAGHVRRIAPQRSIERQRRPRVDVVDLGSPRPGIRRARLSPLANRGLGDVVSAGGRAVVLASRGGVGAALACTNCGRRRECPVCAGSLRPVRDVAGGPRVAGGPPGEAAVAGGPRGRPPAAGAALEEPPWECPGCGWSGQAFRCVGCDARRTAPLAAGAGRLAQELQRGHASAQVVRMEGFDAPGPDRSPAIAVMTRGSVVDDPRWLAGQRASLVVAPDADGMLSRPSVDAAEDTLRLWFAVARLAGRMVVQTREPGHHAVQALVRWDPDGFWTAEAPRRAEFGFPPTRSLVRIAAPRVEAMAVGEELRRELPPGDDLLGPTPEGAWIVKTSDLWATIAPLYALRQEWDRMGRGVRVDVDPIIDL